MGIGSRLKQAREEKEISLEQLQETTKIQKRYLRAIEEENFKILPGKFYARAFIKEYANAVGLDSNEILEEYKDDIPSAEDNQTTQYTRINRSRKDRIPTKNSRIFSLIPSIIVVLLIVGVVFAGWWFIQLANSEEPEDTIVDESDDSFYRAEENESEEDLAEEPEDDNENEEIDNQTEETQGEDEVEENTPEMELVLSGDLQDGLPIMELNNPEDELILTFETETRVWLDVEKQNRTEKMFTSFVTSDNSPLEVDITEEEQIYLNVGSAPNLVIKINDVPLEYPEDPSESDVQRFWININQEQEAE